MLIGHILNLLRALQDHGMDMDQLLEEGGQQAFLSRQDTPDLRFACEAARFMDEMPGGFFIYRAGGGEEILFANRALLQIFHCDTLKEFREYTGNSFRGMVHPDDLDMVEQSIHNQVFNSQRDLDYVEYRIRRKDGAIRWIEDFGHFVRRVSGEFFYVFISDATEKREKLLAEKAALLQERHRSMESLIEEHTLIRQEHLRRLEIIEGLSVNYESILYADLDDNTILPYRLSRRTKVQFGEMFRPLPYSWYTRDYIQTWVYPEDRDMLAEAMDPDVIRDRLGGGGSYYVNYRAVDRGEPLYLQMRLVNVGASANGGQVVLGFRRVDQEVQLEMEQKQILADALDKANLAAVARNTFLSNMSHDMRTPLNAIFGFTALAKKNIQDSTAVQNYLERVETSSRLLLDFIDKLLELSWAGSNDTDLEESPCDLRDILGQVLDMLEARAVEKGLSLTAGWENVAHPLVYSAPNKLRQMALYLTQNAITYTNPGGKVLITATEADGQEDGQSLYRLEVRDTGIGIDPGFIKHLFEPFAREKNTTLSGVHGMGLGLAITKNIVDMMGGTIQVESQVGVGSVFTVELPMRRQPELQDAFPEEAMPSVPPRLRILLVEDNAINLEIETELLEEMGFHIEPAEDGSVALEKLRRAAPGDFDVVLMDIQMPVMNGWQAAEAIRQLEDPAVAGIPIIALSANVLESDLQKSRECGMDAHLPKPMDIPQLLKAINAAAGRRGKSKPAP